MADTEKYGAARRFPKEWAEYAPNKPMLEVMLDKMSMDLCERALIELSHGEKICSLSAVTNHPASTEIEYRQTITITDLVRCKDCDCWDTEHSSGRMSLGNYVCICQEWSDVEDHRFVYTAGDEYCSRGERREECRTILIP